MGCGASTGSQANGVTSRKSARITQDLHSKIEELFDKMHNSIEHKEGDTGAITKKEAQAYFKTKFGKMSADAMFNEVDEDGNGEITREEFIDFWKQVKKSGYTEQQIMEEVEQIEQGGTWVDWKDQHDVGGQKEESRQKTANFEEKEQAQAIALPGTYKIKNLKVVKAALRESGAKTDLPDFADLSAVDIADLQFAAAAPKDGMVAFEISGEMNGEAVKPGTKLLIKVGAANVNNFSGAS
jgi:hypothetical protein